MEEIECIIVGGPQHGLAFQQLWDKRRLPQLVVTTNDGQPCSAAVQRCDDNVGMRCLLLHPKATGEQILTILAARTDTTDHVAGAIAPQMAHDTMD